MFKFAIVADSYIDSSIQDTFSNIKEVHKNFNFNCLVHLGDFLNVNLPKNYTKAVLNDQMNGFRSSVDEKCFYPVQGNHDDFCDLTKSGGTSANIALDEDWYEATKFVDSYENVSRPRNKPYYYVDYPDEKISMKVLVMNILF